MRLVATRNVLILVALCGCAGHTMSTASGCSDTTTVITPAETTIAVGQQFVAKAESFTCAGTRRVEDEFSWATRNASIAVIHQTTKVVDGVGPGSTELTAVPFHSPQLGFLKITVR